MRHHPHPLAAMPNMGFSTSKLFAQRTALAGTAILRGAALSQVATLKGATPERKSFLTAACMWLGKPKVALPGVTRSRGSGPLGQKFDLCSPGAK